jgi:hypothetical protein
MAIDSEEIWRQVVPEEKIAMMSRAHSSGVFWGAIAVLSGCTFAMALQIQALMWFGIFLSPVVFQVAAGKAWRGIKPRLMLEFLAARSAARRLAFNQGARDLNLLMLFRGNCQPIFERDDLTEALNHSFANKAREAVWIGVFSDTIIVMSEGIGGAALVCGYSINDKLAIESSDAGGYTQDKEVILSAADRLTGKMHRHRITSNYAGALVVFEKRIIGLKKEKIEALSGQQQKAEEKEEGPTFGGEDDLELFSSSF